MAGWTAGDFLFIALALLLIFGILALVNRSRRIHPANVPAFPDPGAGDAMLRRILTEYRSVAVVGASPDPQRPSYRVVHYLAEAGYTVFPINPQAPAIGPIPCAPTLSGLSEVPDIVNLFRTPEAVPAIAREAVALGAKVLWLQEGVISPEGMRIARQGGLAVVMNHCIMKEHKRLKIQYRSAASRGGQKNH